ncbi:protein-glutamate methylesterase/protein-glutamine glutaminase [Paragemmobacter ruber]|uniref:Protein-glutamate methylesterase/protein-glutamine glutaminase n=1 Tax=Paragemmobacter ruber TaxID=1985673 RepID=A0ABW9YAH9_9RHOB|nr:chemotaxis response regulator protein-glutamate methylesterase [Rhodobacter ruber]NBE09149.1 chemotaxis-specific protein-glutamate methyltransferase CheB [Rhodobacter ruber]
MPRPIRVLIVDDSAMVRKVLSLGFSADPGLEVMGEASSAEAAWEIMQKDRPDVVTLDVEMPRIDGLTFLRRFLPMLPVPVVMISSLTRAGAEITVQAMQAGAVDVISKPSLGLAAGLPAIMSDICTRVRAAAGARVRYGSPDAARLPASPAKMPAAGPAAPAIVPVPAAPAPQAPDLAHRRGGPRHAAPLMAIGSSTGGVQALTSILPDFPAACPPIAIVQHMPEGFTGPFAARLNTLCQINVREAADGDLVHPGQAVIAPGGTRHMVIEPHGRHAYRIHLIDGDPVCFSRPSVDVLFESVALCAGQNAIGAILTGMGRDGARGLLAIRQHGGATFAQDEATSVVYGMPMAARELGAAREVLPLTEIPARMLQAVTAPQAARA